MKKNIQNFLNQSISICENLDVSQLDALISEIVKLRKRKGRIFFVGVGGSSANASHAVNDFRKICNIESYTPTDNVSEITARINDDGWKNSYRDWLKSSNLNKNDALFIFSVGGGDLKRKISINIIEAIKLGKKIGCRIFSLTGPIGGYAKKNSHICLRIPVQDKKNITPLTESFQSIIWHLLVSHPKLKKNKTKW